MPDLSFIAPLFLQSAVIPFIAALLVLLLLRKPAAAALAVAVGFAASFFAVYGKQWSLVPHQALDWQPWIVLLALIGALVAERAAARVAVAVAIMALVAWPAVAGAGLLKAASIVIAGGALAAFAWGSLARSASHGVAAPITLTVVAGGAGIALMLDASQLIGQLIGALAAAVAACAVLCVRRPSAFSPAAAGVAVLLLAALLAHAYLYAGFPISYVLLLAAGLLGNAVFGKLQKRQSDRAPWLPAAAFSVVAVLITIGLAIKAAQDAGGY